MAGGQAQMPAAGKDRMLYELRVYNCVPGRLPDLIRRFADHTIGLFAKHRIRHTELLTGVSDPNQLIYTILWDDMAEREQKFPALLDDPAWIKVRDASEANGALTSSVTQQFYELADFTRADKKTP